MRELTTHTNKNEFMWSGVAYGKDGFTRRIIMPHQGWEQEHLQAANAVEIWYDRMREANGLPRLMTDGCFAKFTTLTRRLLMSQQEPEFLMQFAVETIHASPPVGILHLLTDKRQFVVAITEEAARDVAAKLLAFANQSKDNR